MRPSAFSRMTSVHITAITALILILSFCSGCNNGGGRAVTSPAPIITSFAADKETISVETSATLVAVFSGGTGVINNGIGAITSSVPVRTENLMTSTTFTLTVTNTGGTATATTTVVVTPFAPTGSMKVARTNHTATRLQNGKVLIVGGYDNGNAALASAELYDPSVGAFTPTGSLSAALGNHTATLLPNGKVLIVGSTYSNNWQPVCELYDPVTGVFVPTGATCKPRYSDFTATLLQNGKVLVVGGHGGSFQDPSAELYDPATGTFSLTGNVASGGSIFGHTATLLENGKVLIAGGWSGNSRMSTTSRVELYDPISGIFESTNPMNTNRSHHTATLLQNGKLLIAGPFYWASPSITAELYTSTSGIFMVTGSMHTLYEAGPTATLLQNGKVLIAGGSSKVVGVSASPEVFNPSIETFTPIAPMGTPREGHTATLLMSGKVLIAGGKTSTAEIYVPSPE